MKIFKAKQKDYDIVMYGISDNYQMVRCACMCRCANCNQRCGCSCLCMPGKCNCRFSPLSDEEKKSSLLLSEFFAF